MTKRKKIDKSSALYGIIAAILLLCLLDMPYGFYVLVRFMATVAFCYFAYNAYDSGNKDRMILFLTLAALFQPFCKLPLGRAIWNIVDLLVAAVLIYYLIKLLRK